MSSEDRRIVILEFDNSKFDSNVEQSRKVLDKLKSDLNFEGAGRGLESISASAKKFSLSNVGESIGTVTTKFSNLEIIGKRVLENLTDTAMRFASNLFNAIPNQIASGGWSRALKLEQANFQLRGLLGETAEGAAKIEAIMDSVSKSVKGTAYGLDDAAKVASQLVATGIEDSDQMLKYLKGVAGAAAMTGGSYEDIGRIFTTVAGQGRLMGDQLLQFATRGVNVAATLSKQMNITEAEFRDLVSKGQISFQQFAEGMAVAFGEHAYKANETFTGSLANMKAALSRIGADVATPALKNLRDIFNELRPLIDAVHDALQPLIDTLNVNLTKATDKAVTFISALTDKVNEFVGTFKKEAKGAEEASETIEQSAEDIEEVARRVIRGDYGNGEERRAALEAEAYCYELVQNKVNELLGDSYRYEVQQEQLTKATTEQADETARLAEEQEKLNKEYASKSLNNVFGSIGNIIRNLAQYARIAGSAFREVFSGSLFEKVFEFTKRFRNFTDGLHLNEVQAEGLRRIFVGVFAVIEKGLTIIGFVSDKFFDLVGIVANLAKEVLGFVGGVESVEDAFKKISENFSFGETLKSAIENINYYLGVFVLRFRHTMRSVQNSEGFQRLQNAFTKLWETIKKVGEEIGGKLAKRFKELTDANPDFSWLDTLGGLLEKASEKLANFIEWMIDAEGPVATFYHWAGEKIPAAIAWLQTSLTEAKDSVANFLASFNLSEGYNQFIENLRTANWTGIADQITGFFTSLKESFTTDENGESTTIGQALENFFADIESRFLAVQEYLQNVDWNKIKENAITAALTIEGLLFFFGTIKLLLSVSGFLNSTRAVLDKFTGRKSFFTSLSDLVKSVAILIGVLAGSLFVMSKIDNVEDMIWLLLRVLGGIAAVFVAIGTMPFIKTAKMAEFGNAVKGFGIGVALLVPSLTALGLLPWKIVMKGIGYIGLIALELGTAAKIAGSVKAAAAFMGLAVAVDLLVPAITILGLLPVEMARRGVVTLGIVLAELAISVAAANKFGGPQGAGAFLGIALAVDLIVPALLTLGITPWDVIRSGAGKLALVLGEIVLALKLAKGADAKSLLALTLPLGVAIIGLTVLSNIPMSDLAVAAIALGGVMLAIGYAGKLASSSLEGAAAIAVLTIPLLAACYGLSMLADYPWKNLIAAAGSIGIVFLSISSAIWILSHVDFGSGIKAIALLDGFFISLAAIVAGMAGLFGPTGKFPNLMDDAIPVMQSFGTAIGEFVGSIIETVGEHVSSSLERFGEAIGNFGTSITPFIKSVKTVDETVLGGCLRLCEAVLAITATEFINNIATFFGLGKGPLEKFGKELVAFAPYMVDYANKIKGIGKETVTGSAAAAECLATMYKTITNAGVSDGVIDNFLKGSPLQKFGKELAAFGPNISQYAKDVTGLTEESATASARAGNVLAEMYATMINAGVKDDFLAKEPLVKFGEELVKFGPNIKKYADEVTGIDTGAATASATAGRMLVSLYKTVIDAGITDSWGEGEPLVKFSDQAVKFGEKFVGFIPNAEIIATGKESIDSSIAVANSFIDLIKALATDIDYTNITAFGEGVSTYGDYLATYVEEIKDVDYTSIYQSISASEALKSLSDTAANAKNEKWKTFGVALADYGSKFRAYDSSIDGVSYTNVYTAIQATYDLIEVGKAMAYVNTTTMANFSNALESVGKTGVNAFINSFTNSYSRATSAAAGLVQSANNGIYSSSSYYTWWNFAVHCVQGFIDGLASGYQAAANTAAGVGVSAMNGIMGALSIHSPSREFYKIGDFSIQGFVNAFIDGARDVFGAGETMGDVALKALTRPVQLIQQMLDTDLDLTPTITPVLDLTDLANGTTTANGLLSGISGQMFANSLNVGSIQTGETEASYQSKQLDRVLGILSQLADEDSINPVNNTFNIYGDDPRAIADEVSRIIQRQVERREASWA